MTKDLTAAEVREWLDYDRATGVFTWKKNPRRHGKNLVGQRAGCRAPNGYRLLRINRVLYREHGVAWLYVHGVWPVELDHKNRDPSDNRIANLREATSAQNKINSKHQLNPHGYRGVKKLSRGTRFMARLSHNSKEVYLGTFATAEEAGRAVLNKRQEMYGHFVNPTLWGFTNG